MATKSVKNKTRQKRGTGGLRFKNGKYEGTYTVYREDGTEIQKSFMRNTENEINDIKAQLRLLGVVENNVKGINIDKITNKVTLIIGEDKNTKQTIEKNVLVKDYINYFLFKHRRYGVKGKMVEDNTFRGYADKCLIIEKYLGNEKVVDLTFDILQNFIEEIQKDGYAENTVKQTRNMIVSMMYYANKDNVTDTNILTDKKLTLKESKQKKEKNIILEKDYKRLIDYCLRNGYLELVVLLNTGLRVSELAGLTWENINWNKKLININREYGRIDKVELVNGKRVIKRTKGFKELKSKNSYRIIGINEELIELLKEHKEKQKVLAKYKGKEFKEKDTVFTTKFYEPIQADVVWDKVKRAMNDLKITNFDKISTHNFRHSFCTNGLKAGVDIQDMQKLMGHTNINTTMIYTHVQEQQIIEASSKATSFMKNYL